MKNTRSESFLRSMLPRNVQLMRIRYAMREQLTDIQREVLLAYYFQEMTMEQIAEIRGVNKSTISRTLRRAEEKLRQYLYY